MSEATFEAANVEAALAQAAEEMGANADDLQYEVVEEKADFWGGGDTVVIRVWQAAEEAEEEETAEAAAEEEAAEAAEEPQEEKTAEPAVEPQAEETAEPADAPQAEAPAEAVDEPAADDDDAAAEETAEPEVEAESTPPAEEADTGEPQQDEQAAAGEGAEAATPTEEAPVAAAASGGEEVNPDDIVALLQQIFHDMDYDCQTEIESQDDGFLAAVSGADKDLLLEGNGRCLSALELIANNAFRHKLPGGHKVRVDAGDFRSRREEELTDLAFQVAHSAKDAGETQETQPLNPYERRLVHLALAEDADVTTRSRGSGFLKNVQVIPRRSGGNRRRR